MIGRYSSSTYSKTLNLHLCYITIILCIFTICFIFLQALNAVTEAPSKWVVRAMFIISRSKVSTMTSHLYQPSSSWKLVKALISGPWNLSFLLCMSVCHSQLMIILFLCVSWQNLVGRASSLAADELQLNMSSPSLELHEVQKEDRWWNLHFHLWLLVPKLISFSSHWHGM